VNHRLLQITVNASACLTAAALFVVPPALAHVGHGDEFKQQGTVRQIPSNPETDALLGLTTAKPEPGPDGFTVPAAAVVDANGKPLLFVKTQKTYDPVEVETGANFGDRLVITKGIDPTDEVVVAGALSLYAESKKTQQAAPEASGPSAKAKTNENAGLPVVPLIAGAAVVVLAGGVVISRRGKKDA
jgi:cation efflux system membrane fusion protein